MFRCLIAVLALTAATGAPAQSPYPTRPVTMVVGFAPSGGTDIAARVLPSARHCARPHSYSCCMPPTP